jgi:hypothetical protein
MPWVKRLLCDVLHWRSLWLPGQGSMWLRETDLLGRIKAAAGRDGCPATVLLGTPGPNNKQTVLLAGGGGVPLIIAKVASTPQAVRLLENELGWLEGLNSEAALQGCVPSPIGAARFEEVFVLFQSVGEGRFGRKRLSAEHTGFLEALQGCGPQSSGWRGSGMRSAMERSLTACGNQLSSGWRRRAEATLGALDAALGGLSLPMRAAHRDFAPWNIRHRDGGLFVYDWEYAAKGYTPLYDLYHFLLLPLALRREMKQADIRAVLRTVGRATLAWEPAAVARPAAQLLAYLLDLCLFYIEANEGSDPRSVAVQRYGRIMDHYEDWSGLELA